MSPVCPVLTTAFPETHSGNFSISDSPSDEETDRVPTALARTKSARSEGSRSVPAVVDATRASNLRRVSFQPRIDPCRAQPVDGGRKFEADQNLTELRSRPVIHFTMRLHGDGDAMIGRETRMLLRHYLAQGASKSELPRQLGVSRDTIHCWIRAGDLDRDRDLDTAPVRYGPRGRGRRNWIPPKPLLKRGSPRIRSCRGYDFTRLGQRSAMAGFARRRNGWF